LAVASYQISSKKTSVADPDPGAGAFLTRGSGNQDEKKNPGLGSGTIIPDHISKSLVTIFWVKFKILCCGSGPGSGINIRIRSTGKNLTILLFCC
jgi:hypothetical protein